MLWIADFLDMITDQYYTTIMTLYHHACYEHGNGMEMKCTDVSS